MAVQRSRRLRKKMHLDEFQELGFAVHFTFPEGTDIDHIDSILDSFIENVIKPNGLAFDGSGHLNWDGLICLEEIGKCTDAHRILITDWLNTQNLSEVKASELFDIWWDY